MSPGFVIGIVLVLAGVLVSVASPLVPIGENIRPGLGLVLNGLAGLGAMLVGALVALFSALGARRRAKR